MSVIRRSRLKSVFWLRKLKNWLRLGVINFVFTLIIVIAAINSALHFDVKQFMGSQETLRNICLWVGSVLTILAIPGAFFAYLHDTNPALKNRRLRWLPILDTILIMGIGLIFLSTPIAQLLNTTFGTNPLSKR
jgi:hypothetical protein